MYKPLVTLRGGIFSFIFFTVIFFTYNLTYTFQQFWNLTDSDLLPFIDDHVITQFSLYSKLVFQCRYFDLANEDLEKTSTYTGLISYLTLVSINIRGVSKKA